MISLVRPVPGEDVFAPTFLDASSRINMPSRAFFAIWNALLEDSTSLHRNFVRFFPYNLLRLKRLAACLTLCLAFGGCATRKPAPPPPTFPPTSAARLQELGSLPQAPYDRLEIATVVAENGEQLAAAIKNARETAAAKGANALVILGDVQFKQKVGKRTLLLRRITYLAIHRR